MADILLTTTIILFAVIIFFMPKRLSPIDTYNAALFAICFATLTDFSLNLQLKLYSYYTAGVDIQGYFIIYLLFPLVNILFLNFYPFKKSYIIKLLYILAWSTFSILYELLSVKVGMFSYFQWKWWYSALCYPVCFVINMYNHKFVQYLKRKAIKNK